MRGSALLPVNFLESWVSWSLKSIMEWRMSALLATSCSSRNACFSSIEGSKEYAMRSIRLAKVAQVSRFRSCSIFSPSGICLRYCFRCSITWFSIGEVLEERSQSLTSWRSSTRARRYTPPLDFLENAKPVESTK